MSRRGVISAVVACGAGVLVGRAVSTAVAQAQPNRARGEYTMVTGRTNGGGPSAVYVVDSANQELVALKWDTTKQALAVIGYRNLSADAAVNPGR